jgi:two-component system sensor histidine kinase UhpB
MVSDNVCTAPIASTGQYAMKARLKASVDRVEPPALALDAAHKGVWDWDLETNTVSWSDLAMKILGLRPESSVTTHQVYLDLVHPDDRDIVASTLYQCLHTGGQYNVQHRISSSEGGERWVACHAGIIHDRDARPVRMVGTIMDITVLKRFDATLAENVVRLRAILDYSPNMIFVKDAAGRYMDVNRQFERCFHITAENIRGLTDEQIFPSQQAASFRANDRRVLESGVPLQFEEVAIHDDGPHTSIVFKFPLRHADGTLYALCGITTDITERKRTEEALRLSIATFRSAFEYAAIGKALVAVDGRWIEVNRALCEIVGYSEQELLGLTFQAITHPEDLDTDLAYVRQMIAGQIRTYQMEKRYFHKQGHVVWILLSVSLVRDPDGQPLYFISEIQDITDRKRMEEALRDSKQKLKGLLDARERLARNLHDNTIQSLFAIGMGLEESTLLMKEGAPHAPEKLQVELDRLQRVIREVRRYITTTQEAPSDTRLLMHELEDLAIEMMSGRDCKVQTTCDTAVNEQLTSEQADHVMCIAREAISNAMRHSGGCSCWVSVTLVGEFIRLVIEDDGKGFHMDQVTGHTSGLGLSNIKARARELRASLQIASCRGIGTRISLEIPVRRGHT